MGSLEAVVKANLWLIGIVAGLAAIVRPMKSIRLGQRSMTWRRVKAIVTSSDLDREGNVYYPNVIYRYLVNGREYIDGTFAFAKGDAANKAYCVEFVQRHPEGKEILSLLTPPIPHSP